MPKAPMWKTLMRATALTAALLLSAGLARAQAGGMNPGSSGQPGQSNQPGMQQQQMESMSANSQQTNQMQAQMQDSAFVRRALEDGMAEVQLGQLALQKSGNAQVKQFAQRMIDDHTKLDNAMKPVAAQLGVSTPTKTGRKDRNTIAKLSALSGPRFDQAYLKDMVTDHKNGLRDFREEAESTRNPSLKAAATQGLQIIGAHLQMAEQLSSQTASAGE